MNRSSVTFPRAIAQSNANQRNLYQNMTILGPLVPHWTVGSIISIITAAIGISGNGVLLLVFAADARIRAPFNSHLINLLIANVLTMILVYPQNLFRTSHPAWFLGEPVCPFYLHGKFVIQAGVFNGH